MGSTRSQKNKPHKTRFASKSSRNQHKESSGPINVARKGHQESMSHKARAARLNHNKNVRDQKKAALLAEKRHGVVASNSPPIIVALISISSRADLNKAKRALLEQFVKSDQSSDNVMDIDVEKSVEGSISTHLCQTHKLRLTVIEAGHENLERCMLAAKVADVIAFVSKVSSEKDVIVDKDGKILLSMLRAQGLPTVIGLLQDLQEVPMKKRQDTKKTSSSALAMQLPEGSKIFFTDACDDFDQVFRYMSSHRLLSPQWKSQHPYVLSQELGFIPDSQRPDVGTLKLTGYVRGRGLSVNQLVHLTGVGDFQLKQIDILQDPYTWHRERKAVKSDEMQVEYLGPTVPTVLYPNPVVQESLIIENTPDTLAGEQTWPTEEELTNAKKEQKKRMKKRLLPKGTSEYQAAWIVDDDSDNHEESNVESEENDGEAMEGVDNEAVSEEGSFEEEEEDDDDDDDRSQMDDDEMTEEERRAEIERLRAAHAADEEFPDEVDTPIDVPARKRFAKYRGLKSLRTSNWDPKESLPQEYSKIFCFENFQRTQKNVFSKAKEVDEGKLDGSAQLGSYVCVHVKDVPMTKAMQMQSTYSSSPSLLCGLLQHESKMSVLHFSIKKHDSYSEPIKSKESLVFHTGFRVYKTRPIFSTDDINMDKHKLERFLHPGRFSVASVFAPICFPPLPLLVFKETPSRGMVFVASGSLKSVDPDRIILKKIILSGYPQRVHKQRAVVRFMFHNPEDVRWFKPLELWTKYGRRGRIKEPVGTHGSMKCIFDGVLQQRDAVCISLYKRVYPKWPCLGS